MNRVVIFANGIVSQPELLRHHLHPNDHIVCANGGTQHALALGLIPDIIIGDLDSLAPEVVAQMEQAKVTIQRHPVAKDKTDLELALDYAIAQQPTEIMLVTALGGRLDQMLANILLLTRPEYALVRLTLADGPQWAVLLRSQQSLTVPGQPGDTLSLIPLSPTVTGVEISGVQWPLLGVTLLLGSTLTISNKFLDKQATVQIDEGLVLLVHFNKTFEEILNNDS